MTFSIRDLLWLMVVVAILVAWWLDRSRLTKPTVYEHVILLDGMVRPMDRGEKIVVERDAAGQTTVDVFMPGEQKPRRFDALTLPAKKLPTSQAPAPSPLTP